MSAGVDSLRAAPPATCGAAFPVTVGPHPSLAREMRRRGQPVPAALDVEAIVDTGASQTVLRIDLIQQLGLNPTGIVPVMERDRPRAAPLLCH
jgi:hypothetical protein